MCKLPNVFETSTVNITWDTLHIVLTLAIYVTLIIFIWITKLNPCKDSQRRDIRREKDSQIPRCLDITWQA